MAECSLCAEQAGDRLAQEKSADNSAKLKRTYPFILWIPCSREPRLPSWRPRRLCAWTSKGICCRGYLWAKESWCAKEDGKRGSFVLSFRDRVSIWCPCDPTTVAPLQDSRGSIPPFAGALPGGVQVLEALPGPQDVPHRLLHPGDFRGGNSGDKNPLAAWVCQVQPAITSLKLHVAHEFGATATQTLQCALLSLSALSVSPRTTQHPSHALSRPRPPTFVG